MGWNDAYWKNKEERKQRALQHHEKMVKERGIEIWRSSQESKIYSFDVDNEFELNGNPEVSVENMDTVSAILKYATDQNVIALNFASYKNPGGGFLAGSSAQEESLCMESILYEVLNSDVLSSFYEYNNQNKNKALYQNRAILSPRVLFMRDDRSVMASVLTAASPNRKAYMDYIANANEEENLRALRSRIQFISQVIAVQKADVAILGAFGCGVFGQDPEVVAKLFKEYMANSNVKKVVYAVIDKGGHSKEGAYAIFKRIMEA